MIFSSLHAERRIASNLPLASLNKMPTLRSATLLASPWPCHQCSHSNDSRVVKSWDIGITAVVVVVVVRGGWWWRGSAFSGCVGGEDVPFFVEYRDPLTGEEQNHEGEGNVDGTTTTMAGQQRGRRPRMSGNVESFYAYLLVSVWCCAFYLFYLLQPCIAGIIFVGDYLKTCAQPGCLL